MQKQLIQTFQKLSKSSQLQFSQFKNFATVTKYTKDHEWVSLDTETKIARVGITDHAQNELGDIVHLEFPEIGEKFEQGDVLGSIESVKMAADIICPVGGEVAENNEKVEDDITQVNQDAENSWITSLKISNEQEFETLFDLKQYQDFLEEGQ